MSRAQTKENGGKNGEVHQIRVRRRTRIMLQCLSNAFTRASSFRLFLPHAPD